MPAAKPDGKADPPKRLTRQEKVSRTRQKLLDAAMKVVGEHGIAETSIANITREAQVALGTFYMHFESKQALMEQLLPWAGSEAHAHMNQATAEVASYLDYEVRNFDALVDFHRRHPFYFRLLSEAEVATPASYQQHIERSIDRYVEALRAAHGRGELPRYDAEDLEVVATMLTSIKLLLFVRFAGRSAKATARMRKVYLDFVQHGLCASAPTTVDDAAAPAPARASRRPTAR